MEIISVIVIAECLHNLLLITYGRRNLSSRIFLLFLHLTPNPLRSFRTEFSSSRSYDLQFVVAVNYLKMKKPTVEKTIIVVL